MEISPCNGAPTLPPDVDADEFLFKTLCVVVILRPRSTSDRIKELLFDIYKEDPGFAVVDKLLAFFVGLQIFECNTAGQYTFSARDSVMIEKSDWATLRKVLEWKSSATSDKANDE
ncbi:hypothetical protein QR680_000773 [Steinernema hermaphroditum]|uniref:Uncharacterized protein n=1 Tax=Steinernema hermaphroditum TaxID=289476 RepID=A0AA39GYL8_9BILA|nr:hypothetical protein QR680_000773 [Steinernema hermaphroditum]